MPKPTTRDSKVRAAIESLSVELAVAQMRMPMMRLRIEQARKRSGLDELLSPALDDMDGMAQSLATMQAQIADAMSAIGCARPDV